MSNLLTITEQRQLHSNKDFLRETYSNFLNLESRVHQKFLGFDTFLGDRIFNQCLPEYVVKQIDEFSRKLLSSLDRSENGIKRWDLVSQTPRILSSSLQHLKELGLYPDDQVPLYEEWSVIAILTVTCTNQTNFNLLRNWESNIRAKVKRELFQCKRF